MAFYGLLRPCKALCGLLWQNVVFSRGIKSKFIWSCWFRPDHPQLWEIDRREVREIRFFVKIVHLQVILTFFPSRYEIALSSRQAYASIYNLFRVLFLQSMSERRSFERLSERHSFSREVGAAQIFKKELKVSAVHKNWWARAQNALFLALFFGQKKQYFAAFCLTNSLVHT